MNGGLEWSKMLFALGLLTALFAFPVVSLWWDGRRKEADRARVTD